MELAINSIVIFSYFWIYVLYKKAFGEIINLFLQECSRDN